MEKNQGCKLDDTQDDKQLEESMKKNERRSERQKKNKRAFSPDCDEEVKKRKRGSKRFSTTSVNRPCDLLPNGDAFCCQLCKSPYVTAPKAKGVRKGKRSRHVALPQKRLDSQGREMLVCNACNYILDRQIKPKKPAKEISSEQRNRYLEDAKMFAKSLAETLNEPEAASLYCPVSLYKICGCLQKCIKGNDTDEAIIEMRATELLNLMKEATKLREQKCYTLPDGVDLETYKRKRSKHLGLGSGHKKSKAFEDFVLQKRQYLKEDLGLCERATQKILLYSNNFLHKKLKSEGRPCRITRTKGKAALGQLPDIDKLHKQFCCNDKCVRLCLTHPSLLETWRARAASGQTEARKVIAEMLTPAAGFNLNCYQFVSMVTGCAGGTISKVKGQLWATESGLETSEQGGKSVQTGGQRGQTSSTASNSEKQVSESLAGQTQTGSRQEVTSELSRPSQNQSGSNSTDIQDLVQRQQELQEQQQIVQQQIQQALGHTAFQQIPGWIPQFPSPLSHNIGSLNSAFYPAGNIVQSELPMTVPSFSNLPPIHSLPGQLQPEFNHNLPTTTLNVPIVNQFASDGTQMSSFINPGFASVGQGTFGQNFSLDKNIPVESHSGIPHQQNIEFNLQSGHNIGDLIMKTQKQLQPPYCSSSMTSNASLVSDFNQSRNYLPQTITSDINPVLSEESVKRQLPPDSVVIETIPEQVTRPMILNTLGPVPQQTTEEGQAERPVEELMPERIPTIPLANMNSDVNPNAPKMMLTLVDSEKGIAQQIELLTTAADNPLILPLNTNLPTLATMTVPHGDQILSPVEQQRQVQAIMMNAVPPGDQILSPVEQQRQVQEIMMKTDRLIDGSVPNNTTLVNAPVQSDEGSAQLEMNSQCNVYRNSECDPSLSCKEATITQETESNQSILTMILSTVPDNEITHNRSVALQAPFHLEKVDLLFHPDQNPTASNETLATIMVSGHDIPSVVDKSTNTAEHANNEGISTQNIDFNKSDQTKTSVPHSAANYGKLRESKNFNKSNYDKETNISGLRNTYSSSNTDIETQLSKSSQDILHRSESQNIRKHGRKPHKSSNVSREQGFQKLHSKNGKVFLQSTTQRSSVGRKICSDARAGSIDVGRVPGMSNTEVNTSDRRLVSAKTVIPDEKEETYISSENASRQGTDEEVSSGHVKTTPVSKPKVKKTRNKIHITDGVKDKIRQSLNIPILPKPTSSQQSMGRIPVGVQPLQSSLFVIPPTPPRSQTSENITSLLHMSKSKVKIQPPVDQNIHGYSPEETGASCSKHC